MDISRSDTWQRMCFSLRVRREEEVWFIIDFFCNIPPQKAKKCTIIWNGLHLPLLRLSLNGEENTFLWLFYSAFHFRFCCYHKSRVSVHSQPIPMRLQVNIVRAENDPERGHSSSTTESYHETSRRSISSRDQDNRQEDSLCYGDAGGRRRHPLLKRVMFTHWLLMLRRGGKLRYEEIVRRCQWVQFASSAFAEIWHVPNNIDSLALCFSVPPLLHTTSYKRGSFTYSNA